MPTIIEEIASLKAAQKTQADQLAALTSRLDKLETGQATQTTALQNVIDATKASDKRLAAVEGRPVVDLAPLNASIAANGKTAAEALIAAQAATKTLTEVRGELSRISQNADQVAGLKAALTTLQKALAELPKPSAAPDLSGELKAVEDRLKALETAPAAEGGTVDLAPLWAALNELRAALGLDAVSETAPAANAVQAQASAEAATPEVDPNRAAPLADKTRALLDGAGYATDSSIAAAPDADLLAIKGIGDATLGEIRELIPAAVSGKKDGK